MIVKELNEFDASIVIPAYNERENILKTFSSMKNLQQLRLEILVVVDSETDTTFEHLNSVYIGNHKIQPLIQDIKPGPAGALKHGISRASSKYVIVMMADCSDDITDIPILIQELKNGATVVCASRYMSGGRQIGGPHWKGLLSRTAGFLLFHFAGIGTHDPTNSFKGYKKEFLSDIVIESDKGFEMGLELVAKASSLGLEIAEIPTIWTDRSVGISNFKLSRWLPAYLKWFFFAFKSKAVTKGK